MTSNKLNRSILTAASAALLLYSLAIAHTNAAVRKAPGFAGQMQESGCGPQGRLPFPAIRVAPAETIPTQVPAGVPLNTGQNERIV